MHDFRVTVETLHECYEYEVETIDSAAAHDAGELLAIDDGMDPHGLYWTRVEVL